MYCKLFILLLLIFQGVCLFLLSLFLRATCTPGMQWKEKCRSCFCTNGGKISCSKETCIPTRFTPKSRGIFKTACVEGEHWKDDCHSCYCANGKPACTRELCESEAPGHVVVIGPPEQETKTKRDVQCVEGDFWKEDCHTCHCIAGGLAACTKELCLSESFQPVVTDDENVDEGVQRSKRDDEDIDDGSDEDEKCPPNKKEWMEDCNKCYCGDDGLKVCGRALCPDSGGPVVAPMPLS